MFLAIFDLDGTILDTLNDMHDCLMDTMRHFSLPEFSRDTTKSYVGDGIRQLVIRAAGKDRFKDEMETYFRGVYAENMTNKTRIIDGFQPVFDFIKQKDITAVILSNKIEVLTAELVAHYSLDKYFVKSYGGDSFGAKKPSPVPVESIIRQEGAPLARTLMIGDNHTDIESGYFAGVKTCFCSYGYGNLSDVKADFVADKPDEIIKALESLL